MIERCGCSSASSGVELALAHELLDQRVVVGQPLEARRRAAGTRGCRRRGRSATSSLADVGGGQRRAHPGVLAVGARELVDAVVGLAHERGEPLLGAARPVGQAAAANDLDRRAATRPRRPARRPCRRRPRTAASARSRRPRWRARWRPVSVRSACSATRSISRVHVGELAVADPHAVAGCSGCGPVEQLLVEVGAVGRAEVLEHDRRRPGARSARGARRRTDPRAGSRPGRRGRARRPRRRRTPSPGVCPGARSTTSRGSSRRPARALAAGGVDAGRLGGAPAAACRRRGLRGRAPQVLQRAARDPQQEQVEHGQEAELQRDRDRVEPCITRPRSGTSTVPSSTRSPRSSGCGAVDRAAVDAHAVGRAEVGDRPAAAGRARSRRGGARRWRRRARCRSRGCGRSTRRRGATACACPRRPRWRGARGAGGARLARAAPGPVGGRVDHRVAVVGLLGRRRPRRARRGRAAPGCRTRRARSRSSVRNSICGREIERQALAPGVLEQVGRRARR